MACSSQSKSPKYLVLYYSQTGATKAVADSIAHALDADVEQIEVVDPYSGTYEETIERCIAEREKNDVPKIQPLKSKIEDYDVIFLGYPVWFGTCARPILGLLETQHFEGKKVVTFCTFGSGGLESSTADIKKALPKADVVEGYGVRNARIAAMPEELNYFLKERGYIEGDLEPLEDFSEQKPVTPEEVEIFHTACGDYKFPLGTPTTVAHRRGYCTSTTAIVYKYIVDSANPQGEKVQSTIYVLVAEGAKAEFIKVVR